MKIKKNLSLSLAINFVLLFAFGCVFDNGGISGTGGSDQNGGISGTGGPKLPPPESIGVIVLPDHEFSQKKFRGFKSTTHYDQANVLYQGIKTKVFSEMAKQSSLFSTVYKYDPKKDEQDVYHWQFDDTGVSGISQVDFQGKEILKQYEWLMKVVDFDAKEDCLLEGVSVLENTSGSWLVLASKDVKRLQINWEKDQNTTTVLYTNISGGEHDGDSVKLVIKGSLVQLVYTDASTLLSVEIKWDVSSNAGSVIDPDFIDGQERFWDESLDNINDSDNF